VNGYPSPCGCALLAPTPCASTPCASVTACNVPTGEVTSRLSADCEKVSDQVQLNVNVFLRSLMSDTQVQF